MKKYILHGKKKSLFLVFSFALISLFFNREIFAQKINSKDSGQNSFPRIVSDFDKNESTIFDLVNGERSKHNLSRLDYDDKAADIARAYSEKMARENFFSHYDADGNSVLERAKKARLKRWGKIGENLFSIENLADFNRFAVKHWMKSSTHRQNILDREWTTTGIGIAKSKDGEIFITQIFIKR